MRFILILFVFVSYSCNTTNGVYILNEEFNSNQLGWTEEKTAYHNTEISNGELLILSLDTASRFSSNGPRDNSFLWSLPSDWVFETSMKIIDGGVDAGFGFLLYSATLNYTFSLNRTGEVSVTEYDYNSKKESSLISMSFEDYKLDFNTAVTFRLEVRNSNSFELFIDNTSLGSANFRAKSWEAVRIFAESQSTGIKADYYKFQAL